MELDRIIAVRTGKTVYRDGENCIKVFENGYPKDDVLSEALNHARVETTGLNVPAVKAVTQIDGKWAIVTEYIHGKTLDCLMSENHDRRHEYLGKFVDLQLEAFSKTCPLLVSLTEKMRDRIAKANLGDDVKTELLKRLEELSIREITILAKLHQYKYNNEAFYEDIRKDCGIEKDEVKNILSAVTRTGFCKEKVGTYLGYEGDVYYTTSLFESFLKCIGVCAEETESERDG